MRAEDLTITVTLVFSGGAILKRVAHAREAL
jgi:hypothetical protein